MAFLRDEAKEGKGQDGGFFLKSFSPPGLTAILQREALAKIVYKNIFPFVKWKIPTSWPRGTRIGGGGGDHGHGRNLNEGPFPQ